MSNSGPNTIDSWPNNSATTFARTNSTTRKPASIARRV